MTTQSAAEAGRKPIPSGIIRSFRTERGGGFTPPTGRGADLNHKARAARATAKVTVAMDGNPAEELPVNWPDPGGAMEPGAVPDVGGLFYPVCLEAAVRHGLAPGRLVSKTP